MAGPALDRLNAGLPMSYPPTNRRHRSLLISAAVLVLTLTPAAGHASTPHDLYPAAPTSVGTAPTWGPGQEVSGRRAHNPAVALARDGTLTVAWQRHGRVQARQQPSGEPWGPITTLGRGVEPALGVDRAGSVTAVWLTSSGPVGKHRIQTARLRPGGAWLRPELLSRAWDPFFLRLAVNPAGAAIATWGTEPLNAEWGLRAAYRPAGGGWTRPVTLSESYPYQAVMIGPGGVATVAYAAGPHRLEVVRRTPRRWLPPVTLPVRTEYFDVDTAEPGALVAVWRTAEGGYRTARFRDRTWEASRPLVGPQHPSTSAEVAVGRSGAATFVWSMGRCEDVDEVRSRHRTAAGELSPLEVVAPVGADCDFLHPVGNERGDVLLAWISEGFQGAPVHVAYRARDAHAWSPPIDASQGRLADSWDALGRAIASDGNAAIAWVHQYGDPDGSGGAPERRVIVRRTTGVP